MIIMMQVNHFLKSVFYIPLLYTMGHQYEA